MSNSIISKGIDIRDILNILKKRKWFIIVPAIIVTAVAFGASFFLTPKYQSSTIIFIDKPSNVSSELRHLFGSNLGETREQLKSRQMALQAEITSQNYLFKLIRDLSLADDPDLSREAARKRENAPEYSLEQIKYSLLIEDLKERIIVQFRSADLFIVLVEADEPELARNMARRLTEILEEEKARYELEKILDNQSFTDLQLKKTEFSYQQAVDSLNAAKARLTRLRLPENISSETNRLDIISSIDKISLELSDYEKELNGLNNQLSDLNLSNLRLKYTDSIIELRTTIDGQVADYAEMMEKYAWNDQNVININIRINNNMGFLESAIDLAVRQQFSSLPSNQIDLLYRSFSVKENIDVTNSKKNSIQQRLARIDRRLNSIPTLRSEIKELEAQVASNRKYRDAFKTEETTVGILSERAKDRTVYKVVEPAQLPLEPYWPKKTNITLMGLVIGLLFGGGLIFILELLDNSISKIEDIEEEFGLTVVATIPEIEKFNLVR
jgi:uncharacterized protein involved in exopolysaccharide biosynthesis